MDKRKLLRLQFYIKDYRQLRNAGSMRNNLPQGRLCMKNIFTTYEAKIVNLGSKMCLDCFSEDQKTPEYWLIILNTYYYMNKNHSVRCLF